MKKIVYLLMLSLVLSCSSDNNQETVHNLIANPSFENNSQSDLNHWTGNNISPTSETSENGGYYALQIEPAWLPDEGFAETTIRNLTGTISLHFSCEAKVINWTGKIIILKELANGERTEISNIAFDNTQWQNIAFDIDTNLNNTDKLIVHLSAGSTEVASGEVLFDNIMLTLN